ncbi:unnamed protein product [Ilex paraguariensis]|uniref:Uncharacterized protein n=1 Tax=Ilex paraguariensis TaxID=185542 RepID=A0ABC8R4Q3_9AQUA
MLFTNTAIASNVVASNATTSSADAASTAGPASTVAASTAAASTAGQALIAGATCTVGHKSGAVGRCSGNGVVDKYIQLVQPAGNVHKTTSIIITLLLIFAISSSFGVADIPVEMPET